jgi:hypothetical protein
VQQTSDCNFTNLLKFLREVSQGARGEEVILLYLLLLRRNSREKTNKICQKFNPK